MARMIVARILSTIGHPALLAPAVVAFAALRRNVSAPTMLAAVGVPVVVAAGVMAFSVVRVRSGSWTDADASAPRERIELNTFLAVALLGAALLVRRVGQPLEIAAGLAAAGAIVGAALSLRRFLKLSLHTAFAVFAAALLWPDAAGVGFLLMLSLAIAWSRLALHRHTLADVATGLIIGALAGSGFIYATQQAPKLSFP